MPLTVFVRCRAGLLVSVALAVLVGYTASHSAPASAAVTIGHNLSRAGLVGWSAVGPGRVTAAATAIDPGHLAPGGVVAPIGGVVVRWRMLGGANVGGDGSVRLQVLHGNMAASTSATQTVFGALLVSQFPTRLPIESGDRIALDLAPDVEAVTFFAAGNEADIWIPELQQGESRPPSTRFANSSPLVNADIEPDVDGDGYGDETQDKCPFGPRIDDCIAPLTTIVKGPRLRTSAQRATFRFVANEPLSSFRCSLDNGRFKPCASPRRYEDVGPGRHVFIVRATDPNGNTTAAKYTWRVKG